VSATSAITRPNSAGVFAATGCSAYPTAVIAYQRRAPRA
jgi:hypothetical protein